MTKRKIQRVYAELLRELTERDFLDAAGLLSAADLDVTGLLTCYLGREAPGPDPTPGSAPGPAPGPGPDRRPAWIAVVVPPEDAPGGKWKN